MPGYALVIRDGFIVDEGALAEVGGGHDHATRALAIWRAGLVVRGHGRLEIRDGFDSDGRAWDEAEQFGKLRLHLRDVLAEILDNLFSGGGYVLGLVFSDSRTEARSVKPCCCAMLSMMA